MRLNRGDRIAGVDGLQLRGYFQRFGSEQVNYATVMDELSVTKRQAEKLLTELLKLEMIGRCEFQHDKKMVSYQTTIRGNAPGMAKAGKPVARIVRYSGAASPRKPGALAGKIWIAEDFDSLPGDIAEAFGMKEPRR